MTVSNLISLAGIREKLCSILGFYFVSTLFSLGQFMLLLLILNLTWVLCLILSRATVKILEGILGQLVSSICNFF